MGSGKSTFSNILALRDDQKKLPTNVEEQLFPIGEGEGAMTEEVNVVLTSSNKITDGQRLRIIDPPGLD
jgi:hypothetical protein